MTEDDESQRRVAQNVCGAMGITLLGLAGAAFACHGAWPSPAVYGFSAGLGVAALCLGIVWVLMHQRKPAAIAPARPIESDSPWAAVVPAVNPGSTWHQATVNGEPVMQLVGRFTITNLTEGPLRIVRVDVVSVDHGQLAEANLLINAGGLHAVHDLPTGVPMSASFCAFCPLEVPIGTDYTASARLTDESGRVQNAQLKFRFF
ncbi:MAG TPA: hypothetical protein VGC79_20255 [Polyangiaceae bacterium]